MYVCKNHRHRVIIRGGKIFSLFVWTLDNWRDILASLIYLLNIDPDLNLSNDLHRENYELRENERWIFEIKMQT